MCGGGLDQPAAACAPLWRSQGLPRTSAKTTPVDSAGLSGGTDSELVPGSCGGGEDSEVELVEDSWSGSTLHSAACSPDTGPAAAAAPAAAARSSGCTTGRAANHHNNTGEGAGSCACAYCGGVIPDPFDRWYCAECCPSGPAAPWFACAECALGRLLEAGGEAAIAAAWAGALPGPKVRGQGGVQSWQLFYAVWSSGVPMVGLSACLRACMERARQDIFHSCTLYARLDDPTSCPIAGALRAPLPPHHHPTPPAPPRRACSGGRPPMRPTAPPPATPPPTPCCQ